MTKTIQDIVKVEPGVGTRHIREYPPGTVSDTWNEVEWRCFGDLAAGSHLGGVWIGDPGTAAIGGMPFDEFCYLQSGRTRFTDSNGESREFWEGEGFLVPRGFTGQWEVLEPVQMMYVALGPFGDS